jgi:hypothetical protein
MRLQQPFGQFGVKPPDLLAPIVARIVQLIAAVALARAKAVGLAEIDRPVAAVQPAAQVGIDQLAHRRIRDAVLAIAVQQTLAADQREVLGVRIAILLDGHSALPRVTAEDLVDAGKPVIGHIVETAARRMSRVERQHRRMQHVQIGRHGDHRSGQEFDGRRCQQIDLCGCLDALVPRQIRIQETRPRILPQEIGHALDRSEPIPGRPPRPFCRGRRGVVVPGDHDIASLDHAVNVAPALELGDIDPVLTGQGRIAQADSRALWIALALGHDR